MKEHLSYFILTLTSLFTIVNPLAAMPLYNMIVSGMDSQTARKLAFRASFSAFIAMLVFTITGKLIFNFFQVSIDGLRVVGGVLFFLQGYDMLQGKESRTKVVTPGEKVDMQSMQINAITPLAIPVICGPGSITILTVLAQEAQNTIQKTLIFSSIVIVCFSTYLVLAGSNKIMAIIGLSGQKVFFRIMGLILMMIAVEFFFSGLKPYIQNLLNP